MNDYLAKMVLSGGTQTQEDTDVLEAIGKKQRLIIFNDEVNTFDFVIDSLVEVCGHDSIQAEQCTLIIHHKGKCDVMSGGFEDLRPPCEELLRRGLSAEIA